MIKSKLQNGIWNVQKLLKAAGYDSKHPLIFEIATSNSNAIRPYAAEILQRQLLDIGVKVTLRVMEWQAFLNTVVVPRKFDTVLLGWSLSLTPDPYALWHSESDVPGGFNLLDIIPKRPIVSLSRWKAQPTQKGSLHYSGKFLLKFVADNPYLFLGVPNDINVYSRSIKGIKPTINGIWEDYINWEKR
jgi:peptide/nickel transport system substrate-binding protein